MPNSDFIMQHIGQISAFALITMTVLGSALISTFSRNIVHSAYALFFTLLGMAGYYFLLGADFIGIIQVIVYVGGILVLLLFGVLLTSRSLDQIQEPQHSASLGVVVGVSVLLLAGLVFAIVSNPWIRIAAPAIPQETTQSIGRLLLTDYLLAFEFSSVTLLAALIGAAYLVRRREQ